MSLAADTARRRVDWRLDWERESLGALAVQAGVPIPERSGPIRAPDTPDEREAFYRYWTYIAALDVFIVESCAYGINLADDPELRLFLTRQIGDDGFHAQKFRERIELVSGRDPIDDIAREAERQWEIFGDLSYRSFEGFLAFEVHYEMYVVPSMLVNGRTSTINDPVLVDLSAERFLPDEVYHRSWIANWWRRHLGTLTTDEQADAVATLRELDDEGQERRHDDLRLAWASARTATGAANEGLPRLYDLWRQHVQDFLYAP